MSLEDELSERRKKISRDSYPMSIGELMNLYRDSEIDIHPEFQRLFRWKDSQKTRLIESIMLDIPIPPIFVSQNDEGVWDVVDGVQRLSTIFQFVGILKNEDSVDVPPLVLQRTPYLSSFEGVSWAGEKSFSKEQQLFFKRSKLDINIVKKESDPSTKYELFQRLNTGGTNLSSQEIRNCMMVMSNRDYYEFLLSLSENLDFKQTTPITEKKQDEQYAVELVLRLLAPTVLSSIPLNECQEFSVLLDKAAIYLCENDNCRDETKRKFEKTFSLLNEIKGEDVFKSYNGERHRGPFLTTAYQCIAHGVYENIDVINDKVWLKSKIEMLYTESVFISNMTPGTRSIPRYLELTEFGKNYFKP